MSSNPLKRLARNFTLRLCLGRIRLKESLFDGVTQIRFKTLSCLDKRRRGSWRIFNFRCSVNVLPNRSFASDVDGHHNDSKHQEDVNNSAHRVTKKYAERP